MKRFARLTTIIAIFISVALGAVPRAFGDGPLSAGAAPNPIAYWTITPSGAYWAPLVTFAGCHGIPCLIFPPQPIGATAAYTIEVQNATTNPIVANAQYTAYTGTLAAADLRVDASACGYVPGGQSCLITVSFQGVGAECVAADLQLSTHNIVYVQNVLVAGCAGPPPSVTISPSSGAPGSSALIAGSGFYPHEVVIVVWNCAVSACTSTTVLGAIVTDAGGSFSGLPVTIPGAVPAGSYAIGAKGWVSSIFAHTFYAVT